MCQSCLKRADKLRELSIRFEDLARLSEPLFTQRLSRTAAELTELADQLAVSCGLDDVAWADEDRETPDMFVASGT